MLRALPFLALVSLAACGQGESNAAQRIDLEQAHRAPLSVPATSPDTTGATWSVSADGQAIDFGNPGAPPLISLGCDLAQNPPAIVIVRHAETRPGQSALFPVLGNGMRSRFLVDAVLHQDEGSTRREWRWEGALPADDPQLDVFTGPREITATLPGAGMLEIAGSRIPGEFVEWCRRGGNVTEIVEDEEAEAEAAAE